MVDINLSDWNVGFLPGEILAESDLTALTGSPSGNPIWKSNNPEKFTSDGWLMQHSRDGERGGKRFSNLSGKYQSFKSASN